MLNSQPVQCTDPTCRASSTKLIHRSRQWFAAATADGRPGVTHLLVYRCSTCGHTWATRSDTVEFIVDITSQPEAALRAFA